MMDELSLHIIDLFENSVRAKADLVEIILIEDESRDEILLIVKDNGKGIRNNEIERVIDPFYTTKKKRKVGLGISLLHQTSLHCGGDFKIISTENRGTTVIAKFRMSHIDLPPIGNIESTIVSLITHTESVDFKFTYRINKRNFVFDTRKLRRILDGIPLTHPEVLRSIKNYIREGLISLKKKSPRR